MSPPPIPVSTSLARVGVVEVVEMRRPSGPPRRSQRCVLPTLAHQGGMIRTGMLKVHACRKQIHMSPGVRERASPVEEETTREGALSAPTESVRLNGQTSWYVSAPESDGLHPTSQKNIARKDV